MLKSLFDDPELNQEMNLVISTSGNIFAKYAFSDGRLNEVNSGHWYRTAYQNLVVDPENDFLCPIIFSMDKTTISNMASLSVYAIMFTTLIFNIQVSLHYIQILLEFFPLFCILFHLISYGICNLLDT